MIICNARIMALAALIALLPVSIFAHGITRTIEQGKAMQVTALYDGGEPISYAAVKIYSPGERTVE